MAWDSQGRFYISTYKGNQVIRVNQSGLIDLVIGNGLGGFGGDGGVATAAGVALHGPHGLAVDSSDNLFIADSQNSRVRKVDAVSGNISTIAGTGVNGFSGDGGAAASAQLGIVWTLTIDSGGNLYMADLGLARVRKISAGTGIISTIAGGATSGFSGDGGPAVSAGLGRVAALAVDGAGNLYIVDLGNFRVRKVTAASGTISTIAGNGSSTDSGDNGSATSAGLGYPNAIAADAAGNIYVNGVSRIRKISAATGVITTYAGNGTPGFTGGTGLAADLTFSGGGDLSINLSGNVLYADTADALVLKINGSTPGILLVGDPTLALQLGRKAAVALISSVSGLSYNQFGLFLADPNAFRLMQIYPLALSPGLIDSSNFVVTYAGDGNGIYSGDGGIPTNAGLGNAAFNVSNPIPISTDPSGNTYFIATGIDLGASTPTTRIRKISSGVIYTPLLFGISAGDLLNSKGLVADGASVYFTDGNGNIRRMDAASGIITTVAQNTYATAIDKDAAGNLYFVSGSSIGKVAAGTAVVSTIAGAFFPCSGVCDRTVLGLYSGAQLGDGGPAVSATLNAPQDVKVDRSSGNIYIADTGAHRVRMISAGTGIISTIAGANAVGCSKDQGAATSSLFSSPSSLAGDLSGNLFVGDSQCVQVSKVTPAAPAPSYAGYLDNATCTVIFGWAADNNRLGQSISVSIYDGSTLLGTVTANQSRTDVGTMLGDNGAHGFTYAIPGGLGSGASHNIHVVYESSTIELGASPRAASCSVGYVGYVDSSSCSGINGWVADRARLNQPILVTLWDGASQIASVTANGSRSDVGAFLGDNGLHGFSISIPALYSNGVLHTLQVRYETSSTQVPGLPITLTCGGPAAPNYAGYVDTSSCTAISGWAADKSRLDQPIMVSLWDAGSQIASVTAVLPRSDVGLVLRDAGFHAFTLPIPVSIANGVPHTLQVRYEASARQLPNSPVTLTCGSATPNYVGWVDSSSCNAVSGWAADKFRLNQSIVVSLWDGGTQIALTTAKGLRSDVGQSLGDNGLHGFSLPIPPGHSNGLQVRFETSTAQLTGSPVTVRCGSATPDYVGNVDVLSCSGIVGWAADRNNLNKPVSVRIYIDSTLFVSGFSSNLPRADVGYYLGDNGYHGFTDPIGFASGYHTITIFPGSSTVPLTGPQSPGICGY